MCLNLFNFRLLKLKFRKVVYPFTYIYKVIRTIHNTNILRVVIRKEIHI